MILIKGNAVILETVDGEEIPLPKHYGIIHDPEGDDLPRCEVFFGPYRLLAGRPEGTTRSAVKYFGRHYQPRLMMVNIPENGWRFEALIVQILYKRGLRGAHHAGGFHHPFQKAPLTLSRSGRYRRLSLPNGCIVDDRGFVFP